MGQEYQEAHSTAPHTVLQLRIEVSLTLQYPLFEIPFPLQYPLEKSSLE